MRATKIERHEIEHFVIHCAGDAARWTIEGLEFNRWCINNNKSGESAETEWLNGIVIPYLTRRFDYLEISEDGHLYGFRNGMNEQLCPGSYHADSLSTCMVAECPGQEWRFALGCCRKRMIMR